MPWRYSQRSGYLQQNDVYVEKGYSGSGIGYNNPALARVHDTGPVPVGRYQILPPFHPPETGACTLRLLAGPQTRLSGRSGFMIHGDSRIHPGQASSGCIVLDPRIRRRIWLSGDHVLEVVP
ncbi:tlde1 domain-containing protein [Frateuria aurantia]|uniref:Tlde1 domain-containing protein n=1 Tax=Frateuria aurantia (strain ATCC 33424 / DSM 6220 / KCTC 2777 / LMG 1558 / NBRC 3245 / NCIMB 13370) TaxID=767434 RepID=H8L2G0_FRAAD|nr:tlde1 domain-containing protein [Frateuria aurantia]AFC84794.1 hypothetical protein Fraau_0304 [Frateuria aurantia DSM 6220]